MRRTVIRCQAPHPGTGQGIHGAELAIVDEDLRPTNRLLSALCFVRDGEHGAWCRVCKLVTVYEEANSAAP